MWLLNVIDFETFRGLSIIGSAILGLSAGGVISLDIEEKYRQNR
jgi:hypothetical protein